MDAIIQDLLYAFQPLVERSGGFVPSRRSRLLLHDLRSTPREDRHETIYSLIGFWNMSGPSVHAKPARRPMRP